MTGPIRWCMCLNIKGITKLTPDIFQIRVQSKHSNIRVMFTQMICITDFGSRLCKFPKSRVSVLIIFSNFTVNFLNIRTPKNSVVITLKFELCGSAIG